MEDLIICLGTLFKLEFVKLVGYLVSNFANAFIKSIKVLRGKCRRLNQSQFIESSAARFGDL